ncbi:MAG TPA: hypothetical protein VK524_15115 [Polyangiaceae bacterium]|nr:hypothetical protein [Polyangiaceae bacterium]
MNSHRCSLAVWAALSVACSAQRAAVAPASGPTNTSDVLRYMPLTNNTVYAYETSSEDTAERGVLMLRVRRPRENMAELGSGSRVQRLELGTDGIRHATGGHLLKSPLASGSTWQGQFGEVTVVTTDRALDVPAGKFSGCIETVEQARAPVQKKVKTVFCPEVGIALLEAEGMVDGNYTHERAALRSFGPAVDLSAGEPPP